MNITHTIFTLCLIIVLNACADNPLDIYDYGSAITTDKKLHVFLIGIDGWGAYSLPKAAMPTVKRMMEEGSYTLKAENVLPTGSNPNWVSLFSGTSPAFHGFTSNTKQPTFPPVLIDEYGYFPNIFALIKKRLPVCTVDAFYEYEMIGDLIPSVVLDTSKPVPGLSTNKESVQIITNYINNLNREKPSFTFIQFDGADGAGHSSGHNSSVYYTALSRIDGHIAMIKQAVRDAGIEDESVFIVTADHGGIVFLFNTDYMEVFDHTEIYYQHGGNIPEVRQIPLIFYGKHIKPGTVIVSDVRIYDIAPTIAAIFGIPLPLVWLGRSLTDRVCTE